MTRFHVLCLLLSLASVSGKKLHPIPTYFGHRNADGTLLDRESDQYNIVAKTTFVNHISRKDASASIQLQPNPVKNGGSVTVKWSGVADPQESDFIAYYCPYYDNPKHYLDYFYVTDSLDPESWKNGTGVKSLVVYNMRSDCIFRYYRAKVFSQLVTESEYLKFENGKIAPLQGHLSMTNKPTEMRVMWVSGEVNEPAVVKYGLNKQLELEEYEIVVKTYSADSFCQEPANSTGFWHPGYIFDALLKNLKPKTTYYYSYGTPSK